MKKAEVIQEIVRLICENGVAMSDVNNGLNIMSDKDKFDLAVKDQYGYINRVPLSIYPSLNSDKVVGIYPFKDSDYYLEKQEQLVQINGSIDCLNNLAKTPPSADFFYRLHEMRNKINPILKDLDMLPLGGIYFVLGDKSSLCWAVNMSSPIFQRWLISGKSNDYTGKIRGIASRFM